MPDIISDNGNYLGIITSGKITKHDDIPAKYLVVDEDGKFIGFTPEFEQAINDVKLQLSKHIDKQIQEMFCGYLGGIDE